MADNKCELLARILRLMGIDWYGWADCICDCVGWFKKLLDSVTACIFDMGVAVFKIVWCHGRMLII